jgi:hypothetical protein
MVMAGLAWLMNRITDKERIYVDDEMVCAQEYCLNVLWSLQNELLGCGTRRGVRLQIMIETRTI